MRNLIAAIMMLATLARSQDQTPLARVEALQYQTARIGKVTVYFDPADRQRALELGTLTNKAAALHERDLGLSFDFRLAALSSEDWFSDYPDGPYTIPWAHLGDRMIIVPASGARLPGEGDFHRAIEFITLHEYGHLAIKHYFLSGSDREFGVVHWFDEFLATYFGYAFLRSVDPDWADALIDAWKTNIEGYRPKELSLDWGFMTDLPPDELGKTYAWYQNLLNLRVSEMFHKHGTNFLKDTKHSLPWSEISSWTTPSLLRRLDKFSRGWVVWASDLENRD